MNMTIYPVTLDLKRSDYQAELRGFKVGDTKSRQLVISLTRGSSPFILTGLMTAEIRFSVQGEVLYDTAVVDVSENIIKYTVATDALIIAGTVSVELRISESTGDIDSETATVALISSPKFRLIVEGTLGDDSEVEAEDRFSELTEALSRVTSVENGLPRKTEEFVFDFDKVNGTAEDEAEVKAEFERLIEWINDAKGAYACFIFSNGLGKAPALLRNDNSGAYTVSATSVDLTYIIEYNPANESVERDTDPLEDSYIKRVSDYRNGHLMMFSPSGHARDSGITKSEVSGALEDVGALKTKVTELDDGKVDKVAGKGLSTNDFTNAYKVKLEGVEESANKTVVDEYLSDTSTNPVQNKTVKQALDGKFNPSGTIPIGNIPKFGQSRTLLDSGISAVQLSTALDDIGTLKADVDDLETTKYTKPTSGIPASDLASGVIPTVPTALSQLSADSTHRTVTDAEKSTWNGKQDTLTAGTGISIINGVISCTFANGNEVTY